LLVLALGCGLAAAFMTQRILAKRNDAPPEIENVPVVVARKLVPAEKFILDPNEWFEVQEKPANLVPSGAIRELKNVSAIKTIRLIPAGDFVKTDDIQTGASIGLPSKVPAGMRAVPIPVDPRMIANGLIQPDMRLDVIHTYKRTDNKAASRTILQNMLVLAVDNQLGRKPDGQEAVIGQTVTLAVWPKEAQVLNLAQQNGTISFSVRSLVQEDLKDIVESRIDDTISVRGDREPKPETTPEVKPEPKVVTVAVDPKPEPKVVTVAVEPKPVDPPPAPEVKPEAKFHTLVIVRGDGEATAHQYPIDDKSGKYGIDVKKTTLEEPRKPEAKPEPKGDK